MSASDSPWRRRLPDAVLALVSLAHLWPMVTGRWLITLDGPCHLYNARLAMDLIAGAPASEFFNLNHRIEPNLLGYALLGLFQLVGPAWLSAQLLYAIIIVSTALAFRSLARTLAPDDPWAPLLGIPFLLTYPLVMGFFNFSFGFAMMLLAMAVWERLLHGPAMRVWPMLLVGSLLYLAHLTAFIVGGTWMVARLAWAWWNDEAGLRARSRTVLIALGAALVLPALLTAGYFLRLEAKEGKAFRFEVDELLQWAIDGRAWITFSYDDDLPWTRIMALALLALAIIAVALAAMKRIGRVVPWMIAALALFTLYLTLPDVLAGGSLNSPRMLLFTMLFLAAAVMAARLPQRITMLAGMAIALASLGHLRSFMRAEQVLQSDAADLLTIAPRLNERSVVLPLNYSDNWLHSNLSNLLGAATGAVILDHFVAQAPFAPVQWRPERLPYGIGDFDRSNRPCARIDDYREEGMPLITHVLTFRMPEEPADSCTVDVTDQLGRGFERVAETEGGAVLYQRR